MNRKTKSAKVRLLWLNIHCIGREENLIRFAITSNR